MLSESLRVCLLHHAGHEKVQKSKKLQVLTKVLLKGGVTAL